MAVRASTAPDPDQSGPSPRGPSPIRTCIGCRQRAAAAELLRVVVAPGTSSGLARIEPDPRHRAPGRGAWLHRDPTCVALAERRRAFARALRVSGPTDPAAVREYVAKQVGAPASGSPQE